MRGGFNIQEEPLLGGGGRQRVLCSITAVYFLVMAINGALIGALGPSLQPIGRAIGLNDAVLARYVLQNRLCKLGGTLVWCIYARRLQHSCGSARPHAMFAGLMLVTAASAVAIGAGTRPLSVQVALLTWGIAYGITDSGVSSKSAMLPRPSPVGTHPRCCESRSRAPVRSPHRVAVGP